MRRRFSWRGGLVTGVALVVASFSLLGIVRSGAASTTHSTLRCGTDPLTVIWRGTTGGMAGHFGDLFWIRNEGPYACVVSGYPMVSFFRDGERSAMNNDDVIGDHGIGVMGVARLRRPPSVRLAPGETASFWVVGTDVVTPCTDANQIVVSLKSLSGWAEVPVPAAWTTWPYCGTSIVVYPVVAGLSGSDPTRSLRGTLET